MISSKDKLSESLVSFLKNAPSTAEAYRLLIEMNFPFELVESDRFYRPVADYPFLAARLKAGWTPLPEVLFHLLGNEWLPQLEAIILLFLQHGTPVTDDLFIALARLGYRASFLKRLARLNPPSPRCYSPASWKSEKEQEMSYFNLRSAGIPLPTETNSLHFLSYESVRVLCDLGKHLVSLQQVPHLPPPNHSSP